MNKITALILVVMVLAGCAKNPLEPMPPIVDYGSFEETMAHLKTSYHAEVWLRTHTKYTADVVTYLRTDDFDLCEYNARYMYENRWGSCGHFAAIYVYAARTHGQEAGGFATPGFWIEDGGFMNGHLMGWVRCADGKIRITDNNEHALRSDEYDTLEDLKRAFPDATFLNEKFQEVRP